MKLRRFEKLSKEYNTMEQLNSKNFNDFVKKNEYEDRVEYEVTYTIRGKIGVEKELFISKN